jgi:hypothetical protein
METPEKKIAEILKKNSESLHISRIPINTKRRFKEIAEQEFSDDYGLFLKYIVDLYDGIMNLNVQVLLSEVEELKMRVVELENKSNSTPTTNSNSGEKKIKLLDGSELSLKH